MQNKLFILVCVLMSVISSCTDPFAKTEFMAFEDKPIGLYLETKPEYSLWVQLLKKADLFNAINMSSVSYTCFIADNDAVNRYLAQKDAWSSIDDITEDEAKNLLKYHIIPTDYAYVSLAAGKLATQSLSGDYLTVTLNSDGSEKYLNNVLINPSSEESSTLLNGYIHQLSDVLDPIIYTVWEMMRQNSNYSIFADAVEACGLDAYLNTKSIEVNKVNVRVYRSVLMVSNDVFRSKGINSIEDLNAMFSGEPTDVKSDFYRYVGYHIFGSAYDFADLTDFVAGQTGQNLESFISREFVSFSLNAGEDIVTINPTDTSNIHFVSGQYDIPGNNGFIHEISGLMRIAEPLRYAFVWEPTEWDEFKAIEFYRKEKIKNVDPDEFYWFTELQEHVRWKTIPEKTDAVGYLSSDIDWDRFLYDDCMVCHLGPVGWVEFDTPTIMRGKYNISVVKWAWFEQTGIMQMYIDNVKFGNEINNASGPGTLDIGTFDFEDSGTHVFRFNVVKNDGWMHLDRFIFTPVN